MSSVVATHPWLPVQNIPRKSRQSELPQRFLRILFFNGEQTALIDFDFPGCLAYLPEPEAVFGEVCS